MLVKVLVPVLCCSLGVMSSKGLAPPSPRNLRVRKNPLTINAVAAASPEDSDLPSRKEQFRRRGMSFALFSTYFAVMGAKCALPSVLSLLISPKVGLNFAGWESSPQSLMAKQLTLATFAVATGKALLGPLIDRFGGVLSLQVCLGTLIAMLAVIASSTHFVTFAVAWLLVDFVFSSCWAGCINAVHQNFPEKEWPGQIGSIAAAARLGNACAFFLFAVVLQWSQQHLASEGQPWRLVFGASAFLQIVPISLLSYFGRMKTELSEDSPIVTKTGAVERTTIASSLATLGRESAKPEFWLHLISRSALMVFGSFLLFVPTLMSQVYRLSSSQAAKVGSVFAIGCLLSVTVGSKCYSSLTKRRKIVVSSSLMMGATLCALAQLGHVMGKVTLSPEASILTMFLWGFTFSVPFYIPPSMFALSRGGKEGSATISDAMDFVGFGGLAIFNGYVAGLNHSIAAAWVPAFAVLTGCSVVSLLSLALATYLE